VRQEVREDEGEIIERKAGGAAMRARSRPAPATKQTSTCRERRNAVWTYSTVTDLARLRGWSTSFPVAVAA
jgi:hypothetical protein